MNKQALSKLQRRMIHQTEEFLSLRCGRCHHVQNGEATSARNERSLSLSWTRTKTLLIKSLSQNVHRSPAFSEKPGFLPGIRIGT